MAVEVTERASTQLARRAAMNSDDKRGQQAGFTAISSNRCMSAI
jgi:hypothetical protein